jgi:hypothetical protein
MAARPLRDLAADVALAAGERVAAGVDLDWSGTVKRTV